MHRRGLVVPFLASVTLARSFPPGAAQRHEDVLQGRPISLLPEHRPILDLGAQPLVVA